MPKLVKEIVEGVGYSYSSEQGQIAESQPRVFRVILNAPDELINIEDVCGVKIGDELRPGAGIFCTSFDARFEGNSRLVLLCTFQFRNTPDQASSEGQQDPKSQPPDVRPSNWTISSSLYEIPMWSFFAERTGATTWGGGGRAANPARDVYDGLTTLDAMVTISIQQFEKNDPTKHVRYVGTINNETITLGSLSMPPHTVMFRGVASQPTLESWGGRVYRGWNCNYEFAYKANDTLIWIGSDAAGGPQTVELGWDVAIPQTGFNVICFAPPGNARQNPYGQPLKLDDEGAIDDDPLALPDNLTAGRKGRAMIEVPLGKKSSLAPSASPIALNDDGTPRATNLFPIVRGYQVHRDIDLTQTLGLRLF